MYTGPNRYICSVFDEMRALDKTKNYSCLLSLIEEAQMLANRMEAALGDQKDVRRLLDEKKKLKTEIKQLEQKKEKLNGSKK